ncbi:hypothetical protein ACFV3R_20660 [Streptomyces sp. NPDC059740]|uniref:hypothetical protein n=1 Tax=Streptomyces sp. NPDC059740 TaxID=3346926 RepID=UPI003648BE66
MSSRHVRELLGKLGAAVVVGSLTFALVSCGDESPGNGGGNRTDTPSSAPHTSAASDQENGDSSSGQEIAELKGASGVVLRLTQAKRDNGGFVTVSGELENTSGKLLPGDSRWRGDETDVRKHGISLAGATLVDGQGKKRYYVLRDTEGRCLCTTGLAVLKADEKLPVFMQFPAPPNDVSEVSFELPTFPPATVQISG